MIRGLATASATAGLLGAGAFVLAQPAVAPAQEQPYQIFNSIVGSTGNDLSPGWIDVTPTLEAGSTSVPRMRAVSRLSIDGLRFLRDGEPVFLAGLTAFDLSKRVLENDTAWLDWMASLSAQLPLDVALFARMVVSTKYRGELSIGDGLAVLSRTLAALQDRGIYALVIIGVDTRDFGMTEGAFLAYWDRAVAIIQHFDNAFVEAFNQNSHHVQQNYAVDDGFLAALMARGPPEILPSAGSTHGSEEAGYTQGLWISHHAIRNQSPEFNADRMREWQAALNLPLVSTEPIGIAEADKTGRTTDSEYVYRQAREARAAGLAGVLLHLDAGLEARTDQLGPIQRRAVERWIDGMSGR